MARRRNRAQQQALTAQMQANQQRNSNSLAAYAHNYRPPSPAKGLPAPAVPGGVPGQSPPGQPQAPANEFTPDAEYLAAAAQRAFDRKAALDNLTSQGTTDKADTQEAIRRLLGQAPEQRQGIKQGANKAGLLYGSTLGKNLDAFEADLTQKQGDINLDFQRREDARAAARQAIESGAPLEEAAAMAEATTRQIERDTSAANAGALVPTPGPAAATPTVRTGRRRPPARRRPIPRGLRR